MIFPPSRVEISATHTGKRGERWQPRWVLLQTECPWCDLVGRKTRKAKVKSEVKGVESTGVREGMRHDEMRNTETMDRRCNVRRAETCGEGE